MPGRPPLGLSVEITDASGTRYRWDSAGKAANIPQSLSFSTKKFEGFEAASCTLSRRIDQDYVDIGLYHDVAFIGDDGSIAYEGRIASNPRSLGEESHQMTVNCAGWMAHTKDRKFSEIYVDRDISAWGDMPLNEKARAGTAAIDFGALPTWAAEAGGLVLALPDTAIGANSLSEAWYTAPVGTGVAKVQYVGNETTWPGTWEAAYFYSNTSNSLAGASTNALTMNGAIQTATLSAARRYVIAMAYTGATATPAKGSSRRFSALAVYGNHGLTTRVNPTAGQPDGLYASDVLADILSRFCPKLSRTIQATTYAIPHLVFKDRVFPYDAFLELNKYHLWQFGVWENKTFCFQPNDLTDYDWEVRLSDPGVTVELQGDSTEDLANGIVVQYRDVLTGETKVLTPDDTPSLADASITNPANTHGLRVWTEISVSSPTTADAATQIGIASLAEFNQPKAPGTIRVKGHIKDRAGHWQQGWKVRAGDTVAITDHPNSRPRLVGETSWDHESKTLTIACDTTIERLPAVFDRIGVALTAANLS